MKHENRNSTRRSPAVKTLISGIALSALLGFSINAQAQSCTIDNWTDATGLTNANTGTQGADNRRYGGPCGLRVDLDGSAAFLVDESPLAESSYNVRFYGFFDDAGSEATIIYAAADGIDDVIQVWYNFPNAGDINLRVLDQAGDATDLTFTGAGSGWHSIEFTWDASSATDNVSFVVNSDDPADDLVASVDLSGISIVEAQLGNINGVDAGSIDFDDFDSRRVSRPGRLLVADAADTGSVGSQDLVALLTEINENGFAPGQPDCNEDGSVSSADLVCTLTIVNNQ